MDAALNSKEKDPVSKFCRWNRDIKKYLCIFNSFYAHIWIHTSADFGQGDVQDASTNCGADGSLSVSVASFALMLSSSPL